MTKEYLESVRQGEVCLPDGPVFLNPDSLIHALKREVGRAYFSINMHLEEEEHIIIAMHCTTR